jgi:hypothetical protein
MLSRDRLITQQACALRWNATLLCYLRPRQGDRQQFLAENQNIDYPGASVSSPGGAVRGHGSGEGRGKIFLALSRDNPLKTLDSKEQKKGKEDQKKGKESKTALSRTFHSLRKGFPTLPSGVARTK